MAYFGILRTAMITEGSVQNWTNRFIVAVLGLKDEYMHWPTPQERSVLKDQTAEMSFFKDCVGFVDGTLIPLATAPRTTPEDYWTRKSFYAYNIMLVCDIHRRVTYYELGWCGSVHDQRVFRSSAVSSVIYLKVDPFTADSDFDPISCLKNLKNISSRANIY